ncbi:hypothetical protein D7V90_08105 [bacterium 1xD42-87]|nr:hypothetical protein D7V90_08105 [bacterium 1xD42-87]
MNIDRDDPNRNYFLNLFRNIVKKDDGYCLQKVYEEDENGNIRQTDVSKSNRYENQYSKNCYRCTYSNNKSCLLRTKLEGCSENNFIPFDWVGNCDAYSPIYPLRIIKSEKEMIDFIEIVKTFFECPEEYESYFGFKRKWDEETGEILETTKEYYDRGGRFNNIPDKFPCVIYFGIVDFNGERMSNKKLNWIYVGEES